MRQRYIYILQYCKNSSSWDEDNGVNTYATKNEAEKHKSAYKKLGYAVTLRRSPVSVF